jgi:hypothetical protein
MFRVYAFLAILATAIQPPTFANAQECSCDTALAEACGGCNGCCGLFGGDLRTRPRLFGKLFGAESPLAKHGIVTDFKLGQYWQGVPPEAMSRRTLMAARWTCTSTCWAKRLI